jgi:hypothetical protein
LKGLAFRLAAILLGLAPLLGLELMLRACGLGRPTDYNDPFVGFSDIHPLFVLNERAGKYEIPISRQTHFRPESFAAVKPRNEFRIFVLGGSTVQGRPYSIETSFTTWLELGLNAADPSRRWEVVNCGGVSYATYRLAPIMQEVLAYQPDLIVFCEGHNEFLEDRSYAPVKAAPPWLAWPQRQVARLRSYTLIRDGWQRLTSRPQPPKRPLLGAESDARLDWKGGMAAYHRDPQWQRDVIAHFDFNLRRMAAIADDVGVPLLWISPVSNLNWPPFKSEHRAGISAAERSAFDALLQKAADNYGSDLRAALAYLQQARAIDDQHAQVHYEIGSCYELLQQPVAAQAALIRAKDLDVCPLRMLESQRKLMRRAAVETGVPLLDAHALIARHSRLGYPGSQWLIDHVHPTIEGHQLIAEALVDQLTELNYLRPAPGWESARQQAYERHLASLGHPYFARGKQRLASEQGWAHGRVTRERNTGSARSAHLPQD